MNENLSPSISPSLTISFPEQLPISERAPEIIAALQKHQVVVIAGETGSGKTTQIPKMCVAAGLGQRGKIGCTQPRRIAALSVSKRIAEEVGATWGREVGCKIRFSDNTQKSTLIKVMTDGMLLSEIKGDPLLTRYEVLIIDEAHERSLTIDFLLGYLRHLLPKRPDLKIVITSATIDTELFSIAFNNAPIFQVSGRLYPVEIRYRPLDTFSYEEDEISYVDAAIEATEELLTESFEGDALIFMPAERDIRECSDRLSGSWPELEVLPLMGSLSAAEQERVFRSSGKRKVIVATNIAETSLTLPNIRYVIDTGLARMSRYSSRSRTKRLPIEPISLSSANQRSGRAGRVREGVCVRLYSEEDLSNRPLYTDPEIMRANLADVILRMRSLNLGAVEDFPFLNPPDGRAVRSGYTLLQELGALDTSLNLTSLGRELAKLPVDPTIGRILLQAQRERCLSDALVIAAGLSIQDPRERPLEQRDKADARHKQFLHPDSDFLALLHIWNKYQAAFNESKSAARRFCKENFLSYIRMREWYDVAQELGRVIGGQVIATPNTAAATTEPVTFSDGRYRSLHRAILSGLLGQLSYRIESNTYRGSGNREITIAPGSSLSEKHSRLREDSGKRRQSSLSPHKQRWIVSAEIVETSRLFARTSAKISPQWIEEMGKHLVKRTVESPEWDSDSLTVVAKERCTILGLPLASRRVHYANINGPEARDLFIRSSLILEDPPVSFDFARKNRALCDKIASTLAFRGTLNRSELEESLVTFYSTRLPPMGSVRELNRYVNETLQRDESSLTASQSDLWMGDTITLESAEFPDQLTIADTAIKVHYRYAPGSDRDGVTLSIPLALATKLPARALDGAIPGLREKQISYLLRELPKPHRLQLDSYSETARRFALDETLMQLPLVDAIRQGLAHMNIHVRPEEISIESLPDHLRPRIEIQNDTGVVTAGRDLAALQNSIAEPTTQSEKLAATTTAHHDSSATALWSTIRARWERTTITTWDIGDLPEAIPVTEVSGVPIYLYPALVVEGTDTTSVSLRLLNTKESALSASDSGINHLISIELQRELLDLNKQCRAIEDLKKLYSLFCTSEQIRGDLLTAAKAYIFSRPPLYPLAEKSYRNAVLTARSRIPGLMSKMLVWTKEILELRQAALSVKRASPGLREDLSALIPPNFLVSTPFEQLEHLPRYVKAIKIRAERADVDPHRDKQRADQVAPFVKLQNDRAVPLPPHFRWMVEEFKVSLFAQELGTAYPISAQRLQKALDAEKTKH